jgi:hypothetical protein
VIRAERFVQERACYALLGCYRRAELPRAAAYVIVAGEIIYTQGLVSICSRGWNIFIIRS